MRRGDGRYGTEILTKESGYRYPNFGFEPQYVRLAAYIGNLMGSQPLADRVRRA
ncbi:hypothetical protein EHYA_05773 [Embleya hyalina]|uniref:Uncharacterized protein n=1 Tax=Embleya hyalina TaxID=516124 RepID=A0A401YTX9_9ACTN|nr:hypothetical protein EHYA_05773 [Embleya hyalina]